MSDYSKHRRLNAIDWQRVEKIEPQSLDDDSLHLWWADLNIDEHTASKYEHLLTDKQRAKLVRLPHVQQRCRYVAGRVYLRALLTAYVGEKNRGLSYNEFGKPRLENGELNVHFNYTDTQGMGVFCFAKGSELGVDIESQDREGGFQRIIERRFSTAEQRYFKTIEGQADFSKEFLNAWTRKEAFGKALGVGLNYPLREHDLYSKQYDNDFTYEHNSRMWHFQQFNHQVNDRQFSVCVVNKGAHKQRLIARQFVGLDVINTI